MSDETKPGSSAVARALPWVMAVMLLLLAYPAWQGWRQRKGAPAPPPATQMTLTPAEQAEFEAQLYALMPRIMMKDAVIEKVYKEGQAFVMVVKSGDTRVVMRMQKDAQPDPGHKPAP